MMHNPRLTELGVRLGSPPFAIVVGAYRRSASAASTPAGASIGDSPIATPKDCLPRSYFGQWSARGGSLLAFARLRRALLFFDQPFRPGILTPPRKMTASSWRFYYGSVPFRPPPTAHPNRHYRGVPPISAHGR